MKPLQLLLLVIVCSGTMVVANDSGPGPFHSLRSPDGFGPFVRGTRTSLSILVGNKSAAVCTVHVSVESDSGSFSDKLVLGGKESRSVAIDLKRIQYASTALLTVYYEMPSYYGESSTAKRELRFVWEHIGVRLDSLSSIPWEVGTGKTLTLQFSPAIAMPRVDSCTVSLVSADGLQQLPVYQGTSIPTTLNIAETNVAALRLGSKVVTTVRYADKVQTQYHIDIDLPIVPTPVAFTADPALSAFTTNQYGVYRTPSTPAVPNALCTLQLQGIPEQCNRIVFEMVLEDSATVPFDTVVAPGASFLSSPVSVVIPSTNIDVRTTSIRANMYVRAITRPFDVDLPVTLATQRALATVTSATGGPGRLTVQAWNPHNDRTPTVLADTAQVLRLQWPIGRIDSLETQFLSASGLILRTMRTLPMTDRYTNEIQLDPRTLPPTSARIQVRAFIKGVRPLTALWDTTITMLPSLPSFRFQRQSEYTTNGALGVNDVLAIGDLPQGVDSIRLTLRDGDSARTYLDTVLAAESAPYRGSLLFSGGGSFAFPRLQAGQPIRSIGFYLRSTSPVGYTVLQFKGNHQPIQVLVDQRGLPGIAQGTDTLHSSVSIRTHDWHYVALVMDGSLFSLYVDGGYQGQYRAVAWNPVPTGIDSIAVGDGASSGDSLFSMASFGAWGRLLTQQEVLTIQVKDGDQSSALRYLPLSDAQAAGGNVVRVPDEVTRDTFALVRATPELSDDFTACLIALNDIGSWRSWSANRSRQAVPINATVAVSSTSGRSVDTVPGLIQLQSIAEALDSASCPPEGLPLSRIESRSGWGPFNTLASSGSTIVYYAGYTWAQAAATDPKDGLTITFSLQSQTVGITPDSVSVTFSRQALRDSAATSGNREVVVASPRPLRMDLVNDSSFAVFVESTSGIPGIPAECLLIQADVSYSAPPPIPVVAHNMGPFRQSMIPTGQLLMNDFTAFTDTSVEDNVEFVVLNSVGARLRTVPAQQIRPGVWRASIDMASCMPPTARVYAQSYDRGEKKRRSDALVFTIRANRPAWISRGSDVIWSNLVRDGDLVRVSAHVELGPVYRQAFPKRIPLLSGLMMLVLPMDYKARLEWNTKTNRLRAIKDSSTVNIWYTSAAPFIDFVNDFVGDVSNALSVYGAYREFRKVLPDDSPDVSDPVVDGTSPDPSTISPTEPSGPDIPNLNWDLSDTETSSFIVDENGDLTIHSTFLESGIIQFFPQIKGIQQTVTLVIGEAEDDVEDLTLGTVDLNVLPVLQGAFEILIRSYVGADERGNWGPRGTLSTKFDRADSTSMTGIGMSQGLGLAIQLNVLQGVAAVTCAFTGNLVEAGAFAYTLDDQGALSFANLESLGFSMDVVIFSQELWGAEEQYLYGPTSVFKARLAGDDLKELYPLRATAPAGEEYAQSNAVSPGSQYHATVLVPQASPSPRMAAHNNGVATVWVDQDHTSGRGSLQVGIQEGGSDTIVAIHRIAENGRSMVSPQLCSLSDSTILVVWKEIDIERGAAPMPSRLAIHATSDIQWAVFDTDRGELLSSGEIISGNDPSERVRELMVDGSPYAARLSDTSAMVVWVAADTAGAGAAVFSSLVHGTTGGFSADPVLVVDRSMRAHLAPIVTGSGTGEAYCTWRETDSVASDLYTSMYDGRTWSTPRVVAIPNLRVHQFDVDESGVACIVSGVETANGGEREALFVLQADGGGSWDPQGRTRVNLGGPSSMSHHPRISVLGDSAVVLVRTTSNTSASVGLAVHRMTCAVVDLRTGQTGYGAWIPTDSLAFVHDHDVVWDESGAHIVTQEHLPFSGLHTNATIQRPLGLPQMNLGIHTSRVRDVITGVHSDPPTSFVRGASSIEVTPTPAWSTVSVRTELPFTRITVYSLGGTVVSTPYDGASTHSTTIDASALAAGTYILMVDTPRGIPAVTLLRVGGR